MIAAAGLLTRSVPSARPTSWQVSSFQGAASMGGKRVAVAAELGAGQLLRTEAAAQLTLLSDEVGKIDQARFGTARRVRTQGDVAAGKAPCLHLGAAARVRSGYSVRPRRGPGLRICPPHRVDAAGNGLLHVDMGWVAFQYEDRESFIPAGAECVTRKQHGPGVPFYGDASGLFRGELAAWEAGDAAALPAILKDAPRVRAMPSPCGTCRRAPVRKCAAQCLTASRNWSRCRRK